MNDVHVGNDGVLCRRDIVHVPDNTLVNHGACIGVQDIHAYKVSCCIIDGRIERRHIDAVYAEQLRQKAAPSARSAPCVPPDKAVTYLGQYLLSLADDEEIEEVGNRLDIVDTRSTADDKRHILTALRRMKRNSRQIEHIQHIRVDHLVLKGEAKKVKCADGMMRFE